jgi:hypothetical protein
VFPLAADQIRESGYHLAPEAQAEIAWIREQQHGIPNLWACGMAKTRATLVKEV